MGNHTSGAITCPDFEFSDSKQPPESLTDIDPLDDWDSFNKYVN